MVDTALDTGFLCFGTWIGFWAPIGQNTFETSLTLPVVNVSPSNFTVIRENKPPDRMLEYLRYLPKCNVLLQGYFLSHKYFANVKHDVRKEFTFSRRIQQEVREYYKNISPIQWKKKRFERVGIHSAYSSGHSTETAPLKVHHDIAEALDRKCMASLVLFDLSPAFDIIDHKILLTRHEHSFVVTGSALSWIKSYLSDISQCVAIGMTTSEYDTQVYMAIMPKTTWSDVANKLEACLADISTWMSANMFKLNEEKTELIIFNPKHQFGINEELRLQLDNNTVSVASSEKNVLVYFDTSLTMERQENAISKACYYPIRNIGHIKRYITLDPCKTLAHAMITFRLDYGNALLYGIPSTLMARLQKVQNYSSSSHGRHSLGYGFLHLARLQGPEKPGHFSLAGDRGSTSLPQTGSPSELTEILSFFFINKIQNIRQTDQMHGIDQDFDTSSWSLDPVPTWLLKLCVENGLHEELQSAYRRFHSTQTAFLKVQSDILESLDNGFVTVLVKLDLSAAFDTLDHGILLSRFENVFGISGVALKWIASYLTDRFQVVVIDSEHSKPVLLKYGVPKGSVLGPKKYTMYAKHLVGMDILTIFIQMTHSYTSNSSRSKTM
ncbi:hypothetical protein LSH36_1186g01028 [Paralvinella palmiformis]|uniref:Reverse transcriptase domain-containing protein n=1 Tax=Paralvinella palmiformis TaxID=53620 RepID=A0AAD9IUC1_9ANNE|nr:hypothetical protein LSH36_1186g01028 [Paralvinella palmiformis]